MMIHIFRLIKRKIEYILYSEFEFLSQSLLYEQVSEEYIRAEIEKWRELKELIDELE